MAGKVAVVGAGAAGMMAATVLLKAGLQVDIFEQNSKAGKKILVSGNGHCNITNKNLTPQCYHVDNIEFIQEVLRVFDFKKLEAFFGSLGMSLFSKSDGKTYPLSYEAKSVVLIFTQTLQQLGGRIFYEYKVTGIKKRDLFCITCKQGSFDGYDSVIVTSGGPAAPALGGSDDGYAWARSFGHNIKPSYAVLVPLILDFSYKQELSGVKTDALTTLFVNNRQKMTIAGDVLFTKYGISGLAILDISFYASLALVNRHKVFLSINLLPAFNRQTLAGQISRLCKNAQQISIFAVISAMVAHKLALVILKMLNIDTKTAACLINQKQVNGIANSITNFRVKVVNTRGFEYAEAAAGGIDIGEIDAGTMESKKCRGLYFAGEVLDVVGKRGGYNFHFAFASGFLAAKAIMTVNK